MLASNVSTWLYLCLAGIGAYLVKQVFNKNPASYHPATRVWPLVWDIQNMPRIKPWLTFRKRGKRYGTILRVEVLGKRIIVIKSAVINSDKKTTVYSYRTMVLSAA
ncbi:hypothetical protein BDR03DRAFT_748871 [Suillus americanus]|nr:hypothetical protein BDR03DRAFT_748871 [Suillus americanus]